MKWFILIILFYPDGTFAVALDQRPFSSKQRCVEALWETPLHTDTVLLDEQRGCIFIRDTRES